MNTSTKPRVMDTLENLKSHPASIKVYRWEAGHIKKYDDTFLTLSQCENIIKEIWYSERSSFHPRLSDGRGAKTARATRECIFLPRCHRKMYVVLHELSHSLLMDDCGTKYLYDNCYNHGSSFLNKYINLLSQHMNFDKKQLIESLSYYDIPTEGIS